nr:MAG TPA: head closure knob [Caudoviricetes sp.]
MEIIKNKNLVTNLHLVTGKFSTCDISQVEIVKESITGVTPRVGYMKYYSWSKDDKNYSTRIKMSGSKFLEIPTDTKVWVILEYEMQNPYFVDEQIFIHEVIIEDKGEKKINPVGFVKSESNLNEKVTEAVKETQSKLNSWIQNTLSTPVTYFKISGIDTSRDVILNEFGIYEGSEGVCLGVHIKDNIIPTEKPEYKEWGLDWESFEIEISVKTFSDVYGKGVTPTVGDFLYIKSVNRMYSVLSFFTERDVSGEPTSYTLKLSTYEGKKSIINEPSVTETLENVLISTEEIFSEEIEDEFLNSRGTTDDHAFTLTTDSQRSILSDKVIIKDKTLMNSGTKMFNHFYEMKEMSLGEVLVMYKNGINLSKDDGISISATLRFEEELLEVKAENGIIESSPHKLLGTFTKLSDGSFITREDDGKYFTNSNFTGVLSTLPTLNLGTIGEVLSIQISGKVFEILDNNFNVLYSIDIGLLPKTWYTVVVNFSNQHRFLGLYIWERNKKLPVFEKEIPLRDEIILKDETMYITAGVGWLTNIRVLNKSIPTKHQRSYFMSDKVPQVSTVIIEDNARPLYNSRKYDEGTQRRDLPDGTPL